jgi:hypothetical protein
VGPVVVEGAAGAAAEGMGPTSKLSQGYAALADAYAAPSAPQPPVAPAAAAANPPKPAETGEAKVGTLTRHWQPPASAPPGRQC